MSDAAEDRAEFDAFTEKYIQLLALQKRQIMNKLVAGIAHNLKNPLAGIRGFSQLVQLDYPQIEEMELIIKETDIMSDMLESLARKSRLDNSEERNMLQLNDMIALEFEILKADAFFKHEVQKELVLDSNLPEIPAVYYHLSHSFINLIQNSLDAMIRSTEKVLTVKTDCDTNQVFLTVQDSGCGIEEAHVSRIFDPFFTTKNSANAKGIVRPGMGLTQVKHWIEGMGGHITVSSTINKGSIFKVSLPISPGVTSHQ